MEPSDTATIAQYDKSFEALDTLSANYLTRAQCEPLFERAALRPEVVERLWSLADTASSGVLDRSAFRRLMHLATRSVQGLPLPDAAPPEANLPALTADDTSRYDGYFVLLDAAGSGLVSRAQAEGAARESVVYVCAFDSLLSRERPT